MMSCLERSESWLSANRNVVLAVIVLVLGQFKLGLGLGELLAAAPF